MQIPLNQFEQYIEEPILKRGLSYFKKGYVDEPEEITTGVYQAIVTGSQDYLVDLKIKQNVLIEYRCTCPYDIGPVCKHVAAVLFYLQQDVLGIKTKDRKDKQAKEKKTPNKTKKKTIGEQVNELLESISQEDLKKFIREKSERDPSFRNLFISSFAYQNPDDSKSLYVKQIKSLIRSAKGKDNFIGWNKAAYFGKSISQLMTVAEKNVVNKNYKSVIYVCTAIAEEMTKALQFADDSNADISTPISFAFELLHNLARKELPEEVRTDLFDYCLTAFAKGVYEGWDWHFALLHIASEMIRHEKEGERILSALDQSAFSEFEWESAQILKYQILRKTKGEKESDKFIAQNLSITGLRKEAISKSIAKKDYEKAIALAKEGIKKDEKVKPGLVSEWYNWLLKIVQAQNNREKIVEYARWLFIDHFSAEQDYYQILKSNLPPKTWNSFVEEMIKDIKLKDR